LKNAFAQLHPNYPGIVVVQTPSGLDESLTRTVIHGMLASFGEKASNVSAFVFLPVPYGIPTPWALFNAFVVHNPRASVQAAQLDAFSVISKTFLERKLATPTG